MLKFTYSFCIMVFMLVYSSYSQNKLLAGAESSLNYDVVNLYDPDNNLELPHLFSSSFGVSLKKEFNSFIALETGIRYRSHKQGYTYESEAIEMKISTVGFKSLQVPLRLITKTNLFHEKVFLNTIIGYDFCINIDFNDTASGQFQSAISDGNTYLTYFSSSAGIRKSFSIIESGLGIEICNIYKDAVLNISTTYSKGLNKVSKLNINYVINDEPIHLAESYSTGESWCINLGLKYPIKCSSKK